jgi:hypothetical protein
MHAEIVMRENNIKTNTYRSMPSTPVIFTRLLRTLAFERAGRARGQLDRVFRPRFFAVLLEGQFDQPID